MTILFIDDDPDDTEVFCEAVAYLNASDFISGDKESVSCVTANNGCKALDLLRDFTERPDFIFLDINMPVMGGKECLKYLKDHPDFFKIPVIMLSTSVREKDAIEFINLGAVDCIVKPSGFNDLVKVLAKYVYSKHSQNL